MVQRLILHVGTHKTATTSFQDGLRRRRHAIHRLGTHVVLEIGIGGRITANSQAFADCVLRPTLRTGYRSRLGRRPPVEIGDFAGALRAATYSTGSPTMLLSAEALCFARTSDEAEHVRSVVRVLGDPQVTTVVARRNVTDWRASWEAQLAGTIRPGVDRVAGDDDIDGEWYYDFAAVERFWRQLGEVTVVDFDVATSGGGSVLPSLLESVGLPGDIFGDDVRLNDRATVRQSASAPTAD